MAWTEQCKLSAVEAIDQVSQKKNLPVTRAIEEVSKESGIPYATLQRWYYPRNNDQVNIEPNRKNKE